MEELLKALARATNAVAEYYEKRAAQTAVLTPKTPERDDPPAPAPSKKDAPPAVPAEAPSAPAAPKRGRPRKADTAPAVEAVIVHPDYAKMSEEESAKHIFVVGEQLMEKYPTLGADGPDGQPAPEGFHMLVKIMKERFNVDRVAKLMHGQRLQFMTIIREKLDNGAGTADRVAGAGAGAAAADDPNLGV